MKCPVDRTDLQPVERDGLAVDACPKCQGLWLTRDELETLEDAAFDLGEAEKGSRIITSALSGRACPECGKAMRTFNYRLYDLELEFCEAGHGFWLDAAEDQRVLALMRQEETRLKRSGLAEQRWARRLRHLRSGSFIDTLRGFFG